MRALALILPLALAGCDADRMAARAVLVEAGFTSIELHAAPVPDRPCDWSEPFAVAFTGSRDGKRIGGTLCAASEGLHGARLLGLRQVGPAPAWNRFGGVR